MGTTRDSWAQEAMESLKQVGAVSGRLATHDTEIGNLREDSDCHHDRLVILEEFHRGFKDAEAEKEKLLAEKKQLANENAKLRRENIALAVGVLIAIIGLLAVLIEKRC